MLDLSWNLVLLFNWNLKPLYPHVDVNHCSTFYLTGLHFYIPCLSEIRPGFSLSIWFFTLNIVVFKFVYSIVNDGIFSLSLSTVILCIYTPPFFLYLILFVHLLGFEAGDWTQSLIHTTQVLFHWATLHSSIFLYPFISWWMLNWMLNSISCCDE